MLIHVLANSNGFNNMPSVFSGARAETDTFARTLSPGGSQEPSGILCTRKCFETGKDRRTRGREAKYRTVEGGTILSTTHRLNKSWFAHTKSFYEQVFGPTFGIKNLNAILGARDAIPHCVCKCITNCTGTTGTIPKCKTSKPFADNAIEMSTAKENRRMLLEKCARPDERSPRFFVPFQGWLQEELSVSRLHQLYSSAAQLRGRKLEERHGSDRHCRTSPKGVQDDRRSPKQAGDGREQSRSAGNNTDTLTESVKTWLTALLSFQGEKCRCKPLSFPFGKG